MPSSTNNKQNAMPSSCHMLPTDAKKPGFSRLAHDNTFSSEVTPAGAGRPPEVASRLGFFQVAEELAIGIKHQHITLTGKAFAVGTQATVEGVELLIHAVGLGVNRRRQGIAITTRLFRTAIRLGQQHATLAIGVSTNTFGQLLTFGAMLTGLTLTLGAHPLKHAEIGRAH